MNNHETNPTEENKKVLDEEQLEEVSGGERQMSADKPDDLSKDLLDKSSLTNFPEHIA